MSKKDKAKQKMALERKAKGELKKQLLSYSIAAGAALIGASHAGAGVVYSGPQNILVNSGNPSVGVDFDGGGAEASIKFAGWNQPWTFQTVIGGSSTTGGHSTFITTGQGLYGTPYGFSTWIPGTHIPGQPVTSSGSALNNALRIDPNAGASVATTAGLAYAANFGKSQFVGPAGVDGTAYWADGVKVLASVSSSWSQTGYGGGWASTWPYGNFVGEKGFIGVRFDDGAGLKYGWIEFEGADDASWGRITGWAYDDSGAEIHAGDEGGVDVVPEPGGLALLAAGAAGLTALRKKRTK